MPQQCAFPPLAHKSPRLIETSIQMQHTIKQPTNANQMKKIEGWHTWLRKGRMRNHLSLTCLSPRTWFVKFSKGTQGRAFVTMSAVCTAVEHCLTFKIPCWMSFWIKHTRRAMCLLHSRKCFENIGGFELWEAQLDCQLTIPHDFTAAPSKRHELCLCTAQRNNLRKS